VKEASPTLEQQILTLAKAAGERAVGVRRDLHQHPELAYTECRTASLVARRLTELGYEVKAGEAVMAADSRHGLPAAAELTRHYDRAKADGADPEFVELVKDGFSAVVGILKGGKPGPTVAIRQDMDALPIPEADESGHVPARDGFRSKYDGLMHACGHDGHTAIGLGVAEVLAAARDEIAGTIVLIFQPGEEGGKGALPMVEAGVVDGVDYFIAFHLGMDAPSGSIYPAVEGYLASTKLDVTFRGAPAHAGGRPEQGRNALLGAAQAAMGLYAISRHSAGASRVNVGLLQAGSGRNIIPETAYLQIETRGETAEINEYMLGRAKAVIEGAALAQDLEVAITFVGSATTAGCDAELVAAVAEAAHAIPGITVVDEPLPAGGSEDATFFMRRVQEQGGMAVYIGVGSDIPTGHHTRTFDIQEPDLAGGIATLALTAYRLGHNPPKRQGR
jgi:aminobenzoyl-glutamate utilization protein A